MIDYYKNGTNIIYYDNAKCLKGFTSDKLLFDDLKRIFELYYPTPDYLGFMKQFNNSEEVLDFFCGTKWPENLNDFVEEIVTKLTKGKLC